MNENHSKWLRSRRKKAATEESYGDVSSENQCASPRRVAKPRLLAPKSRYFAFALIAAIYSLTQLINHVSIVTATSIISICTTSPSCPPLHPIQRHPLATIRISILRTPHSTLITRDPIHDHLVLIREMVWILTQGKALARLIRELLL